MDSILSNTYSEVDFSFSVERSDGHRYTFNRGTSTMQNRYESASTSKLVTAVIIMRLVEKGYLNLTDTPVTLIPGWPIPNTDSLYTLTLADLLSFTSGLTLEPPPSLILSCIDKPAANFDACVIDIANTNAANGKIPGNEFYYASTHLQVAGLMAIKARNATLSVSGTWQDVFTEFKTETGLFPSSTYELPSVTNPRLAGGMIWTGDEYMAFLKALKSNSLLKSASMNQLLADHTSAATGTALSTNSPVYSRLGEDWHYGFGLWHECESASYNCTLGTRISSPGAYGAYPFWDRTHDYFGIVARQGALGTFQNGIAIERSVHAALNKWAACH